MRLLPKLAQKMKLLLTFLIMRRASASRVQLYILYNRNAFRHEHLSPIYSSQQKNGAADHLTFEGGGGGGIFLPEASGDRMFFADIQSHCVAGISLQEFFLLEISLQNIVFLNTHTPFPSKVNWLAPNRTLQQLLKLSFCVRSIVIDDFQQPTCCK